MKAKRTVYLVVDYGGEWEDKWDSPYMAFENECGACANGFECSACGCRVEDCEGYYVKGTWNFCPECRRRVVEGGH